MFSEVGLRARKKERTRQAIAEAARHLFKERGFDAVTVDDVAREAEVSRMTVFNYFPTKEDLFYSGFEAFQERLLAAVRDRRAGESMLAAFTRFVIKSQGLLAAEDPDALERLVEVNRLIAESPALRAREQQIYATYTDALAAVIAEETLARPGDVTPWVAANAMIGLHRVLVDFVRQQVLAGERDPAAIARGMRAQARRAAKLLERGLARLDTEPRT